MKGLLRKDFYVMFAVCRAFIFICVLYIVVSTVGRIGMARNEPTLSFEIRNFIGIFAGIIPITLLSTDEAGGWNVYGLTLPYSRGLIVLSRYVFGLVTVGASALLFAAADTAAGLADGFFTPEVTVFSTSLLFTVGLMPSIVGLPIMYFFGVERGRLAYLFVMIALMSGFTAFTLADIDIGADAAGILSDGYVLAAAMLAAALLLYAASCALAVMLYKRRDL